MTQTVIASDGVNLPLEALEQTFAYTGDNLTTITVQYPPSTGSMYVQTFEYSGTNVVSISGWIKQ